MKNVTSYSLFVEGQEDARMNRGKRPNSVEQLSVFYRLGFLYEASQNKPTRLELIDELLREFTFCRSELPNLADICLESHYSHRMLKRTMEMIGYEVPARPNCSSFHAWRVR